jgi:outer membrane protein assembly factor BamD (BamD/ComL family)
MSALLVGAALAGSLMWPWPFGDKDKTSGPPQEQTLGSLEGQEIDLPPDPPLPDAEARARESYRAFLELSQSDPELAAEATRRLADLELEAGENKALDSGADQLQAQAYRQAVVLYQQLLARHPDYPNNDQVLYQLARAQENGGDPLAALATLDRVVRQYPNTPLIDEVQFRRGEILFSHQRYPDAERAYTAVIAMGGKSAFYQQSLYKQGWARYKQSDYDQALDSFFTLLDLRLGAVPESKIPTHVEGLPRADRELIDDTLRVMSMSFNDLGGADALGQQLARRKDPQFGYLLYSSLGALYLEQKRYNDAADTMMGFVATHPQHSQAPQFTMQAVAALEQGGFRDPALAMREEFVSRFGLEQAWWQGRSQEQNQPVVSYLRDSVKLLAQHHHALAQNPKTENRQAEYVAAAAGYRRYLEYFPKDEQAADMQFLLGETLFESADYAGAVKAYTAAAYDYPRNAKSAEAAYASLLAYEKQEPRLEAEAKAAWNRERLDASLRFAEAFPEAQQAIPARVYAAEGFYAGGNLTQATRAAGGVAGDTKAKPDERRAAWRILAHSAFDRREYAQAEKAYLEVRKLDQQAGRKDAEISERLAASIYKQGEIARADGKPAEAAMAFSRVRATVPDTKIATTADYDAAMSTLEAKQTATAIPMLESFRRQNPESPLNKQVTESLALAYVDAGKPINAAQEFRRIADDTSNTVAVRREALWRSAQLYRENNDPAGASSALLLYTQRYPEDFDKSIEAQQYNIEFAQKRRDRAQVLELSRKLVAADAAGGAKRTDRSRYLAAKASLTLAEEPRDAYRAIELTQPLKSSLQRKQRALESALAAYAKSASYGVGEVNSAATYETAELYHELAKALVRSERPRGLDAAATEEYDLLLDEKQVLPQEDRAIELHEGNVRRAAEGAYDDWIAKSYAQLAELAPGRYARKPKKEAVVDAIR